MTQIVGLTLPDSLLFSHHSPRPLRTVALRDQATEAARQMLEANRTLGPDKMDYLISAYTAHVGHDPTATELFMFAQVNSEPC